MPAESHETSDSNECLEDGAIISLDTLKTGESSSSIYAECAKVINALHFQPRDIRNFRQQFGPKITKNISEEFYLRIDGEREACAEKPLDFSKNSISSVENDEFSPKFRKGELSSTITSQRSQENGENSSDDIDDSCKPEGCHWFNTIVSQIARKRKLKELMFGNGSENTAFSESENYRHKLRNKLMTRRNGFKRNELKAANSSGSEDELHPEYSVNNNSRFQATDIPIPPRYRRSKPLREDSPPSQPDVYEMSGESNSHSENGFSMSKETNGFNIQELLHKKSPRRALFGRTPRYGLLNYQPPPNEHSENIHVITNFTAQPRTSPQPSVNLDKEENRPSRSTSPKDTANIPSRYASPNNASNLPASTSPNQTLNLPSSTSPNQAVNLPAGFTRLGMPPPPPLGAIGRYTELNGPMYINIPPPFTTNHISSFMGAGYPGEVPGYSRPIPAFTPGTMLPAAYNGFMYQQPYQQSLIAGQNQQKPKKTRPFKEIDTARLLQEIQTPPELLNSSVYSSSIAESNGPTAENSSPLSPDSQNNINSSSGNEVQEQETNQEGGRKKGRRIPPEEKDERYLEKRRKNNIAAKKSRDERRKKEDYLAQAYKNLETKNVHLEAERRTLHNGFVEKSRKLDMITACLISFREKCEGHTKELFEDTFHTFLP